MEAASVQPDSYTFNTLISAGARAGSGISAAGEWLQIMKSACIKPNEATYNASCLHHARTAIRAKRSHPMPALQALMDVAAKHQESLAAERWFGELVAEASGEKMRARSGSPEASTLCWYSMPFRDGDLRPSPGKRL